MDINAIMDNSGELPELVKHHFRQLLLEQLTVEQQSTLHKIECTNQSSWRHGARGLYKDPVKMHEARKRYNRWSA